MLQRRSDLPIPEVERRPPRHDAVPCRTPYSIPHQLRTEPDTDNRPIQGPSRIERPLAVCVAAISSADGEGATIERAAEAAAEALQAEFAVLLRDRKAVAIAGQTDWTPDQETLARLDDAARRNLLHSSLPGLGAVDLATCEVAGEPGTWLIAGRRHQRTFDEQQTAALGLIAQVLSLCLRVVRADEEERDLRRLREHDARQRERAERELAHQALHDHLTGLPNRGMLRERAVYALERNRNRSGFVAALFLDIDQFKLCNDSLDHRRGDKLLVMISRRLAAILWVQENSARDCMLARPGGDEFIVLCESLETERDAVSVAQQIQDTLQVPFFVEGQSVLVTASIGIACSSGAEGEVPDADALLRDADVALSRAKERGRDRYEIFDAPMRARVLDRVALESDLRAGIERDELRLLYQPVVTTTDGTLAAVEALVRWEHPQRGLLGPGEFIPVAEESDLIVTLGSWVIDEACKQIRRWRDQHPARLGVRVSVNVSARQLSPALVDHVAAALERNQIDPSQLALEMTESLLIEHSDSSLELLGALRELGVSIVLDDFGTGYSSLGYLNRFPLTQLKLDRTFTADLAREPRSAKIIAATIDMARALGMTVVAEGVETEDQLEVLQRLGCDYVQGFLFARPEQSSRIFERVASRLRARPRDRRPGHVEPASLRPRQRAGSARPRRSPPPPAGRDRPARRLVVPDRRDLGVAVGSRDGRAQPTDRCGADADGRGLWPDLSGGPVARGLVALAERDRPDRDTRDHDLGDRGRPPRHRPAADLPADRDRRRVRVPRPARDRRARRDHRRRDDGAAGLQERHLGVGACR